MGYPPIPGEGLGPLIARLKDHARRIRMLERPDASQLLRAKEKIENLIANIGSYVTAFLAGGFTTASMNATGNITVGGTATVTGPIMNQHAYDTEITYTRHGAWIGNDGQLGWSSSSRTRKDNIRPSETDPLAVLKIASVFFNYKAEIAKRDDPDSAGYVGPDYVVADEFGAIAEDLLELGLPHVVDFDADGFPQGINYPLLGLLAIDAAKYIKSRVDRLEERLSAAGL